ncbi:protein trapped in endoderm-1 [Lepeophtheirus salmonis]|uniref:G-protein coupled receptors family 1 profile domain-containing protein n=1 Tax=Lepeophtheirus salmonis TaxID=72036 RepID=A0A0K2TAV5_LEPSM|nr:protein trapped in endoderm-1-like [Lepeophtheirus salmonis]
MSSNLTEFEEVDTYIEDDILSPEHTVPYSRAATIFAAVCASIFCIVGVLGNLLTIVGLLKSPRLRNHATTMFVVSLAISDLLFSAINLPFTASRYVHLRWIHGNFVCRLFPFFFYGNVAASLMNMVAITINRYVLISCLTTYSRIYSRLNIFIMIFVVWIFSFGMLVPPLAEVWGTLGLNEETFSCTILKKDGKSPKKFLMLFAFLMPAVVIICCYTAIYFKFKQSRRNVQAHMNKISTAGTAEMRKKSISLPSTSNQMAQRREDIRLTKMMLTIFLCFMVSYLPLSLVNVMDDDLKYPDLHVLASVLAWSSAVINPFIYAFKNRQYQQAFIKVLCLASLTGAGSSARNVRPVKKSININNNTNQGSSRPQQEEKKKQVTEKSVPTPTPSNETDVSKTPPANCSTSPLSSHDSITDRETTDKSNENNNIECV